MSSRGAVVLALALIALAVPLGEGVAAQATPPANTAEPAISGRAEQGVRLSASTGTWTGTKPISYAYQWVRCGVDGGQPDGGNCAIVSGATDNRYRLVRRTSASGCASASPPRMSTARGRSRRTRRTSSEDRR